MERIHGSIFGATPPSPLERLTGNLLVLAVSTQSLNGSRSLLVSINTRCSSGCLRKRFHLPSYDCVLCAGNSEETLQHLFLDCGLAVECWNLIGVTINSYANPYHVFEDFKRQLVVPFFMEIIIIMSWSIWTLRNDVIFRGIPASSLRGLEIFKDNFGKLLWRAKKKYFPFIEAWLQQLLYFA